MNGQKLANGCPNIVDKEGSMRSLNPEANAKSKPPDDVKSSPSPQLGREWSIHVQWEKTLWLKQNQLGGRKGSVGMPKNLNLHKVNEKLTELPR